VDGMKETKAEMADIIDIIDGLKLDGGNKQYLLDLVQEKKKGNREAGRILCKRAIILRKIKVITAEQHAQIIVYAWQKEQQKSDNGIWRKLKCWLKEFFSWR
jgi:hypothetical protein